MSRLSPPVAVAVAAVLVVTLLGGCGGDGEDRSGGCDPIDDRGEPPTLDVPVFGRDDRTIRVATNRPFRIALEEASGVGDDWRIRRRPAAAVACVGADYHLAGQSGASPGSAGSRIYDLRAGAEPGRTTMVVKNCYRAGKDCEVRPEDERFAEELTFTIVVG